MSFADVPLGSELQLNTPQGVIAGSVFAYDKPSGILVLKETGSHSGVSNLRVLRTDNNVSIISFEKPAAPMSTVLPAVDMERARRREEKAMQQAEMEASRVGVGVSKEAQAVFEALLKTMPCAWRDKTIVVLDYVHVAEPYTEDMCSADADHQATLNRVKKVLSAERVKLGLETH